MALRGRCAPDHRSDYQVLSFACTSPAVKAPLWSAKWGTPGAAPASARPCSDRDIAPGQEPTAPGGSAGMTGMRCAADDILAVGATLDEREWQTPSAAAGWSVHDNIIHIGSLLELLQAAVRGEPVPDSKLEPPNDIEDAERRDWETSRTVDNLQKQLDQTPRVFAPLQEKPMASVRTPMLDLGTYPRHAIADMFTFYMTVHLRYDILAPRGPITRDLPLLDETRLSPSVAWLLGRFIGKGRALCPVYFARMSRGNQWTGLTAPPVELLHTPCGHRVGVRVVCSDCGQDIDARETKPVVGRGPMLVGWRQP